MLGDDGAAAAAGSGGGEVDGGVRRRASDRMVMTIGVGVHWIRRREAAELWCSSELGFIEATSQVT